MRLGTLLLFLAATASAQNWPQWGQSPEHGSSSTVPGRRLERIEAEIVLDPFTDAAEAEVGGNLLAHYAVPIVDGDDLFVVVKTGTFRSYLTRDSQIWNVRNLRRVNGQLTPRWTFTSDWKPVPVGSASWEPVYHPAVNGDVVWAPGAGGTMDKIRRGDGTRIERFNPFSTIDSTIFVAGPPTVDHAGNVFYTAIKFNASDPWGADPPNSWLVRIGADGTTTTATFVSLTPNAPAANAQCTATFALSGEPLPWPPSRNAEAPKVRCGPQRPGINVAPAVAPDGTIYAISRAHTNDRWGFLVAVNPDLTPKWATSMRNRFQDGCNVVLPPNGAPGGCSADAITGVDPNENQSGSGRVNDNGTSCPVVLPDGRILYGAHTSYNYQQGHLMMFDADGRYIDAYGWGWDLTPAVYQHDGTYSILLKENHYNAFNRNVNSPLDPESYFITQLSSSLRPEWKYQNKNKLSCIRLSNGTLDCVEDHPNSFEWCVNAIAVDSRGVAYANSEDGNLYAIGQGGVLVGRIFLRQALGAAYTPTSIGPDGRIYTQNDGNLFVITENPKRRAVRQK